MEEKTQKKKSRIILEIIALIVVVIICIYVLKQHSPRILQYLANGDIDGLTAYIRTKGAMGEIVLIILQVIETLSIVLPALPVYISAGILFGKIEGILICYITNLILCAGMFLFARRTGQKAAETIGTKKSNSKTERVIQIVTNMKNPDIAVLLMYAIPVMPNGLIPTVSSQTKISFPHFMRSIAIGSFPSIAINVLCGDALLSIDWSFSIPFVIIIVILAIIIFIFRKRIMTWIEPKFKKWEAKIS